MPNNVKVLLVDDNPMVLGLLHGALTPLASVTTSSDTADALLKAVDDPPDLLVSDYRMPGMDGHQLVERLRSRPKTAGIAVILLASKADISEKLSSQEPVDDFVEKPFFLKEATQRIKRVIDKIALEKMAKTAPSDGVLRGNLSQMNVIDLVQSLEMGRKSCALTLTNDRDKCEMYFSEGQVTHAAYGSLTGDKAVFKVLSWTGGSFQINFEGKTSKQTTTLNTQGLLMEGLRMLDESKRDEGGAEEEEEDVLLDSTEVLTAAVLTVSDSSARGERADLSGPAVAEILKRKNFVVVATEIVADDQPAIQQAIIRLADQGPPGRDHRRHRNRRARRHSRSHARRLHPPARRHRGTHALRRLQEDSAGSPQPGGLRSARKDRWS